MWFFFFFLFVIALLHAASFRTETETANLITKVGPHNVVDPLITDAIRRASFITIDAEFGGIFSPKEDRYFDLLEERYANAKWSVENYPLLQLGVSCHVDGVFHTFSFMILPTEDLMSVSVKSMAFLASNDFNFEELFINGTKDIRILFLGIHSTRPSNAFSPTISVMQRPMKRELMVSYIVNLILTSNKPIILHNGLFDLMHLVDKFMMPLPATLREFKQLWQKVTIFDTKFLASDLLRLPDPKLTTLQALSEALKLTDAGLSFHDAGYDALITGRLFIHLMLNYFKGNMATMNGYANKIFIFKTDFPCWNLRMLTQMVNRSDVIHLQTNTPIDVISKQMANSIVVIEPISPTSILIKVKDMKTIDGFKQFGTVSPYSAKRS